MTGLLQLLDRLTLDRVITGYTVEPDPQYLSAPQPVLSYSVYDFECQGRSNLFRFSSDMGALDASLTFHHTIGSTLE